FQQKFTLENPDTGVSWMNSSGVPFPSDHHAVTVPDLKLKIRTNLRHNTLNYGPENNGLDKFWMVFNDTVHDVKISAFLKAIDTLTMVTDEVSSQDGTRTPVNPVKPCGRGILPIGAMDEPTAALYLNDILQAFHSFSAR
ncbi:hypothetical protein C0991_001808, partial [Blastosporella zonata]